MEKISAILKADCADKIIHGGVVLAGTLETDELEVSEGYSTLDHTFPMTADTVIDGASTTKLITITALLICHARGLIDFDAPFPQYLPRYDAELPYPVKVRDLANHTSGFGDVPGMLRRPYYDESGLQMLENVLHIAPPLPRSQEVRYACWNYILLCLILEHITKMPFDRFCEEEIFRPLGMNSSSLGKVRPSIPLSLQARTMECRDPGEISDFVAFRIYRDGGRTGNAGLFSSARDWAKLLRCYLRHGEYGSGKRLFGEKEFAEIAPDTLHRDPGHRNFGWIVCNELMAPRLFGSVLDHSGWSGQSVAVNVRNNRFAIVLTTRCGDYGRAKKDRFTIINQLL